MEENIEGMQKVVEAEQKKRDVNDYLTGLDVIYGVGVKNPGLIDNYKITAANEASAKLFAEDKSGTVEIDRQFALDLEEKIGREVLERYVKDYKRGVEVLQGMEFADDKVAMAIYEKMDIAKKALFGEGVNRVIFKKE